MNTVIYPAKRSYIRYDDNHFLLYLNEEVIEDYLPEDAEEGVEPATVYSYTGSSTDGGTLISAKIDTYEAFVSGLVRSRYSSDQVEAIILNLQSNDPERIDEFRQEMDDLNNWRAKCKQIAADLLL